LLEIEGQTGNKLMVLNVVNNVADQ